MDESSPAGTSLPVNPSVSGSCDGKREHNTKLIRGYYLQYSQYRATLICGCSACEGATYERPGLIIWEGSSSFPRRAGELHHSTAASSAQSPPFANEHTPQGFCPIDQAALDQKLLNSTRPTNKASNLKTFPNWLLGRHLAISTRQPDAYQRAMSACSRRHNGQPHGA